MEQPPGNRRLFARKHQCTWGNIRKRPFIGICGPVDFSALELSALFRPGLDRLRELGDVRRPGVNRQAHAVLAGLLTMETCRNSYLVASGQIEPVEMASNMGQSVFSTVMMLGGAAVATALTGGATFPVLIGSFAGGAAGSMAFRPVSSCVMKVCVNSGITFFGLVEQDYGVPKRLLSMLGIKGASIKTARVKTAAVSTAPRLSAPSVKTACLHTADVVFFERGLVGVNKVAYS
ncbi:hypothetical protein C1881_06655 [Slackia isoflavoniconvertens]|uniref:Uncharacterized protein n=2 Tax=Slackia isoflavoniconvertens TaxID=572010 RepID=A0A369LH11_9ACTN|nr:hypothetical protein C1881_06655 [Slackia isoflavoniconvertens]